MSALKLIRITLVLVQIDQYLIGIFRICDEQQEKTKTPS